MLFLLLLHFSLATAFRSAASPTLPLSAPPFPRTSRWPTSTSTASPTSSHWHVAPMVVSTWPSFVLSHVTLGRARRRRPSVAGAFQVWQICCRRRTFRRRTPFSLTIATMYVTANAIYIFLLTWRVLIGAAGCDCCGAHRQRSSDGGRV